MAAVIKIINYTCATSAVVYATENTNKKLYNVHSTNLAKVTLGYLVQHLAYMQQQQSECSEFYLCISILLDNKSMSAVISVFRWSKDDAFWEGEAVLSYHLSRVLLYLCCCLSQSPGKHI